jgi:hypothetical protein
LWVLALVEIVGITERQRFREFLVARPVASSF